MNERIIETYRKQKRLEDELSQHSIPWNEIADSYPMGLVPHEVKEENAELLVNIDRSFKLLEEFN